MKFQLLFILILSCFSLSAQIDSLALEKLYLQKADSLFERGEYEAARTYVWSANSYFSPGNYNSKEVKERAIFYLEKQRKLDVAITYNLTDSIKYKFRMEEANRWLSLYKDTATAISLFLEAQKIVPNNPEPMRSIKSVLNLSHRRMDTIVISNKGPGKYLFIGKQPHYVYDKVAMKTSINGHQFRYPNYNLIHRQPDTLFCLKDSLPFNGVLISQANLFADVKGTKTYRVISTHRFEHGVSVSRTDYQLCSAPSPEHAPNPFAHFIPLEQDEYICNIQTSSGNNIDEISYYPSGALAGKSSREIRFTDLHERISYTDSGDTLEISYSRYSEDSLYLISSSKMYFETGQLRSAGYSKKTIEGEKLIDEFFERDEQGDTLRYNCLNTVYNTRLSVVQWNDATHLLRLCYSKADSLVGIPTPGMVFLDENYRIISETAFVRNHNKQLREKGNSDSLFEVLPTLQNGKGEQRYNFYAFPKGIYGKETRKHYERISKIQSKLEKE